MWLRATQAALPDYPGRRFSLIMNQEARELPHEQVWSNAGALVTAMAEVGRMVNLFPDGPLHLHD